MIAREFDSHDAPRTTNKGCGELVFIREEFNGSNLYGRELGGGIYVVYSYGHHFPAYVWHPGHGQWYENGDKFSLSTTRHMSHAHPMQRGEAGYAETVKLPTGELQEMIASHQRLQSRTERGEDS